MTVQRLQIYQFDIDPLIFFRVERIYSPSQILIMDVDTHVQTFFSEAKLLATCTLVPYLPQNRVHNGVHPVVGKSGLKIAHMLTTPMVYGNVHAHSGVSKAHGFTPTELRGRLFVRNKKTRPVLTAVAAIGGHVGSHFRVTQASID